MENNMTDKLFSEQNTIMDRSIVPEPIFDERPELIDLYYAAWQSAWTHIFTCPGAPVQTYMCSTTSIPCRYPCFSIKRIN